MGVTTKDVSGNSQDYLWSTGGGALTHVSSLKPGGGDRDTPGTGLGWIGVSSMKYIGDGPGGFNSAPLCFEVVHGLPTIPGSYTIAEGGNTVKGWRLRNNAGINLVFEAKTSAFGYSFTAPMQTTSGLVIIQFVWTNGGMNGQFYQGSANGEMFALPTTRANFVMGTIPAFGSIMVTPGPSASMSHFRILRQHRDEAVAGIFHSLIRNST
jgi:hypothetical protein